MGEIGCWDHGLETRSWLSLDQFMLPFSAATATATAATLHTDNEDKHMALDNDFKVDVIRTDVVIE